jgi:signal transduction histidine kinase
MGETLKDGLVQSEEKQAQYYDNIVRECTRISKLTEDMLELSRLQSGRISLALRKVDLTEILFDARETYKVLREDIEIVLDLDLENSITVESNGDRLEQVVIILLDNALKFVNEGGVVKLSANKTAGKTVIEVMNSGSHIAEEDIPYVFDRFYKGDKAHSGGGSGLGLSIAKEVCSILKHEIPVRNENDSVIFRIEIK